MYDTVNKIITAMCDKVNYGKKCTLPTSFVGDFMRDAQQVCFNPEQTYVWGWRSSGTALCDNMDSLRAHLDTFTFNVFFVVTPSGECTEVSEEQALMVFGGEG